MSAVNSRIGWESTKKVIAAAVGIPASSKSIPMRAKSGRGMFVSQVMSGMMMQCLMLCVSFHADWIELILLFIHCIVLGDFCVIITCSNAA